MNIDDFHAYKRAQAEGKATLAGLYENKIMTDNRKLAMDLCNKYRRGISVAVALEDAEQAAMTGLLLALRKWDPALGTLSNFAGWQILHELQSLGKKDDSLMDGFHGRRHRPANRKIEAYLAQHGQLGTAAEMGVKQDDVDNWRAEPHYVRKVTRYQQKDANDSLVEVLEDPAPNALERMVAREDAYEALDEVPSSRQLPVWVLATRPAYVRYTANLTGGDRRILEDMEKSGDTAARVARRHEKPKVYVLKLWKKVENEVRDFWHEETPDGV
jgi:DNA-directed RNA polymerase specialized sigma subunit